MTFRTAFSVVAFLSVACARVAAAQPARGQRVEAPLKAAPAAQAAANAPHGTPTAVMDGPTWAYVDSVMKFCGSRSSTTPAGHALTHQWTFGDGGEATGANVSHKFSVTNAWSHNYLVTLVVADGALKSVPVTRNVFVRLVGGGPPSQGKPPLEKSTCP